MGFVRHPSRSRHTSSGQVIIQGKQSLRFLCLRALDSGLLGSSEPRSAKRWITPASQSGPKRAVDTVYFILLDLGTLLASPWIVRVANGLSGDTSDQATDGFLECGVVVPS